jgi:hypothetical protein
VRFGFVLSNHFSVRSGAPWITTVRLGATRGVGAARLSSTLRLRPEGSSPKSSPALGRHPSLNQARFVEAIFQNGAFWGIPGRGHPMTLFTCERARSALRATRKNTRLSNLRPRCASRDVLRNLFRHKLHWPSAGREKFFWWRRFLPRGALRDRNVPIFPLAI